MPSTAPLSLLEDTLADGAAVKYINVAIFTVSWTIFSQLQLADFGAGPLLGRPDLPR